MFDYPCTGHVESSGFGKFLEERLGESRKNIREFTDKLKSRLEAGYATLTNSGSSANLVAALAMAKYIPQGSEVIIPSFTFPTTASALILAGMQPLVVDTEKNGFNLDLDKAVASISDNTKAIYLSHFLGYICDMDKVMQLKEKHNLFLIQDCCETFDAHYSKKKLSFYGDICAFSFYHPHHLPSYGGGLVTTNDEDIAQYIESLVHWGRTCSCHIEPKECKAPEGLGHSFHYSNIGLNVEISELNAVFGLFQLRNWEQIEEIRKSYYDAYYDVLNACEHLVLKSRGQDQCSPFVFPVIVKESSPFSQADMTTYLAKEGIETRNFMGNLITEQPAYNTLPVSASGLENSIAVSDKGFFLGIHQSIKQAQIDYVVAKLKDFLEKYDCSN